MLQIEWTEKSFLLFSWVGDVVENWLKRAPGCNLLHKIQATETCGVAWVTSGVSAAAAGLRARRRDARLALASNSILIFFAMPDAQPTDRENDPDEALLGEFLGQMIRSISDGDTVDLESYIIKRPDLKSNILEVYEIAKLAAVRAPREMPQIPGYRILHEIGRGGMGTVYLAIHEKLNRRVALKTLPPLWTASDRSRERFQREARAAAKLNHPLIIPIYDIGESGRSLYYTMELVEGRALSDVILQLKSTQIAAGDLEVADLRRAAGLEEGAVWSLDREQSYHAAISRIVADAADALEHAHANGVIHRDVKPSNILLRKDGRGLLFDFGLASEESQETLTRTGEFVGTAHYVSPEQIANGSNVDARSDVYSLGVALYELLTLERPFRGDHSQQIIREILNTEAAGPRKINNRLPRDLETICLTAMARRPADRYPSAAAFRDDLLRFLALLPIDARAPGATERWIRWMQRNRLLTTVVALSLILMIGVPVSLWWREMQHSSELTMERDNVREAEQRALREFGKASGTLRILQNILYSSDPFHSSGDPRVSEVLARAVAELDASPPADGEVEAAVRHMIGRSLRGIGKYAAARKQLERAVELRAKLLGSDHLDTCRSEHELATTLSAMEDPRAESALRLALEKRRRHPEADEKDLFSIQLNLAATFMETARPAEAAAIFEPVLAQLTEKFGKKEYLTIFARLGLANALTERGNAKDALPIIEENLDVIRELFGESGILYMRSLTSLSRILTENGEHDRAVATARDAVRRAGPTVLEESKEFRLALNQLGVALNRSGKAAESAEILTRAINITKKKNAPMDSLGYIILSNLASALTAQKKWDDAAPLLEELVAGRRKTLAPGSKEMLNSLARLGTCYFKQNQFEKSVEAMRECAENSRTADTTHVQRGIYYINYGIALRGIGRGADAHTQLVEGLGLFVQSGAPLAKDAERSALSAVHELQKSGESKAAAEYIQKLGLKDPGAPRARAATDGEDSEK